MHDKHRAVGIASKKSRFGFWGTTLYDETNVYKNAQVAIALAYLFPARRFPDDVYDPILRSFLNAILHCFGIADVAVTLNQAAASVEEKLGRKLSEITPSDLPHWATDRLKEKPLAGSPEGTLEGGSTPDTPIEIPAANSIEGIPKEYAVMIARFGQPKRDWKIIARSVIEMADGRKLEKFILSVSGRREEIYFDITRWMSGNAKQEARDSLYQVISSHDEPLEIVLPREEIFTLMTGLLRLTDGQLKQIGLSIQTRNEMVGPISSTMAQWKSYESIPRHVGITMPMSVWYNIMVLLMSWEPDNLLQEEEIENLKAIIGGTMEQARTVLPPKKGNKRN
jgi:hypothetical protein